MVSSERSYVILDISVQEHIQMEICISSYSCKIIVMMVNILLMNNQESILCSDTKKISVI